MPNRAVPATEVKNPGCWTTQTLVHSKTLVTRCFLRTNAQMLNIPSADIGLKVSIRGGEVQTGGFGCHDGCAACRRHTRGRAQRNGRGHRGEVRPSLKKEVMAGNHQKAKAKYPLKMDPQAQRHHESLNSSCLHAENLPPHTVTKHRHKSG